MANRYWVINAVGNWNSTANWSSSATGTPGGASVPSTGDVAIFNSAALAGNCTVNISPTVQAVNMTGYAGTLTFNSAGNFITITTTGTPFIGSATATIVKSGSSLNGTNIRTLGTTTATKTITTGTVSEANALNFNISGVGTYALGSGYFGSLSINATATITSITIYGNYSFTVSPSSGTVTMASNLSVAATAMAAGTQYTITSAGTTNFTLYGAQSNTPNTIFTATGAGTGTGTVTPTRTITSSLAVNTTVNIGTGTSQGSVALNVSNFQGALNIQSGFFNNNGNLLRILNSFNYNNTNIKNIKIFSLKPYNSVFATFELSNNTFIGTSNANTTVDFSTATLYITGAQTLPNGSVFGALSYQAFVGAFTVSGNNLTFYTWDVTGTAPGGSAKQICFDAGATINVGNVVSFDDRDPPSTNVTIKSTVDGTSFTLNKLGGGCGYFTGKKFQDVTGLPETAWYANTAVNSGLGTTADTNAAYFGENVNVSGNTNINFTQYPALGGFNQFF